MKAVIARLITMGCKNFKRSEQDWEEQGEAKKNLEREIRDAR